KLTREGRLSVKPSSDASNLHFVEVDRARSTKLSDEPMVDILDGVGMPQNWLGDRMAYLGSFPFPSGITFTNPGHKAPSAEMTLISSDIPPRHPTRREFKQQQSHAWPSLKRCRGLDAGEAQIDLNIIHMDSFTTISNTSNIPTNSDDGGSGNNAYCVIA
ncbi:uncharacterized protein LACBIDRAFT_331877, partial [Laccaria bicolor S238N-H82]